MYKCEKCGGFVEELGEMALSNGLGCKCAQKKDEESANSLQQLKAEISACCQALFIPLSNGLEDENVIAVHQRLQKLSAI